MMSKIVELALGTNESKSHLGQPTIVIASEAKQSRGTSGASRSLDCFVAALLAMTIPSELNAL
jgi:hypothetical protein